MPCGTTMLFPTMKSLTRTCSCNYNFKKTIVILLTSCKTQILLLWSNSITIPSTYNPNLFTTRLSFAVFFHHHYTFIEAYHHCYTIVATEVTIMIFLSSFWVATCCKLVVASLYCCTSEVLDFFMHIWNPKYSCLEKPIKYITLIDHIGYTLNMFILYI
jgi:hypothetical protein